MPMSDREIIPVTLIVILMLHIVTVVLAEGTEVANVNTIPRSLQSSDSKKNMAGEEESSSRGSLQQSNYSRVDGDVMGGLVSEEPSSRAIFLRPPAQLTQEDLELIDKRVGIKVTFCDYLSNI